MNRTLIAVVAIIAVVVLFGVRRAWVGASVLKSARYMPSQELAAEHPDHPLALEKPKTTVTPPYHKPANLPSDWWLRHHPVAQLRGDFDTTECQECHDVEKYCNRCHGYVGVKSVEPVSAAAKKASVPASRPADG